MPTLLKNMSITFISLVKKGANNRKIIIKSGDEDPTLEFIVPIMKIDPEGRRFYSIVYPADEVDKQGEFSTAKEIEKASYDFMKNLRLLNVDKNHNTVSEEAFVAESWIIRKGDPIFPDEKEGSWATAIVVEDDGLWKSVEDGEIEAISMGGTADKILDQNLNKKDDNLVKIDESIIKKIVKMTIKKLSKKGGEDMEEKEVKKLIDEAIEPIKKSIEDLPKPLTKEEMATVVTAAIKPQAERLEKIEKKSKGTNQDEDEIKKEQDLEKVGTDMAEMVNKQLKKA